MTATSQFETLLPNSKDLQSLGWPDWMINDYLSLIRQIILVSTTTDGATDLINSIISDLVDLTLRVDQNETDITNNTQDILDLEHRVLGDVRPAPYDDTSTSYAVGDYIVNPASDPQNYYRALEIIAAPAGVFDPLKWEEVSLQAQAVRIDDQETDLDDHITLNSAHGVTGDNVGTEDFCTEILGGVVLLSDLVNDAVQSTVSVTSADATDLPTVITLANEMKADINTLVTDFNNAVDQVNDFIDKNKTAKQMNTT